MGPVTQTRKPIYLGSFRVPDGAVRQSTTEEL